MGVGQRVVRGAAHLGGVVVVSGRGRVRDVLGPVYAALDLELDPDSVGSVASEAPGADADAVAAALLAELRERAELEPAALDPPLLARAVALEQRHGVCEDHGTGQGGAPAQNRPEGPGARPK
jgi:hypothetical protein